MVAAGLVPRHQPQKYEKVRRKVGPEPVRSERLVRDTNARLQSR